MKNLKIRTKLLTLVLCMLAGLIAIGFVSLNFMSNINEGTTEISENWMPSVIASEELNTLTSDYRINEYAHIVSQDEAAMKEFENVLTSTRQHIEQQLNEYSADLATGATDENLILKAKDGWNKYLQIHDQMIILSREYKTDEAMELVLGESTTLFNEVSATFKELVEFNKNGSDQASIDGNNLYASAQKLMFGAIALISIITILGSVYIILSITKPVAEIDDVARKIADGNLNEAITYTSKDELGMLSANFNKTVTRLREYVNYIDEISNVLNRIANGNLVFELTYDYAGEFAKVKDSMNLISDSLNNTLGQINQSADQVAAGSDQVSSGAQALSQGATEQASSVEELAATINEISGHVKENADNAKLANQQAIETADELEQGKHQMVSMTEAMDKIDKSSSEIGKIIKTIEDIAFQTNILALNAAVEAARAGEAGKGFSVVADEVRNLASKSAEASKNTASLIEATIHAVQDGTTIADATASSLDRIIASSEKSSQLVNAISKASQEQASSIIQVTQGIDQISSVVQTNSATAEESAAASEELSGQAQVLKDLISQFKLKNTSSGLKDADISKPLAKTPSTQSYSMPKASMTLSTGTSKY